MIDHILGFRTEADAKNDAAVKKYYTPPSGNNPGGWDQSRCCANLLLWDPADDVHHPGPPPYTTHTPYDGNWRILVSTPNVDTGLLNSKGMEMVWNRDEARMVDTLWNAADLAVIHYQPVFAGSTFPFLNR